MSKSPMWRRYLRFFGPDVPADVGDEIGFHLESKTRELIDQGFAPHEARIQAARHFGSVYEFATQCEQIDREQSRRSFWLLRLEELRHDFRIAVRGLVRAPKFSLIVIGTLAAGIGGAALLLSIVDSWTLHAVRFPDPSRLVYVCSFDKPRGRDIRTSWADYQDLHSRAAGLQSFAAWRTDTFTFGGGSSGSSTPERVNGVRVTPEFFRVLQTLPRAGRLFTATDGVNGNQRVTVVSTAFWRTRLRNRPLDSGVKVEIDGEPWLVIGVLPESFHFTLTGLVDLWVPLVVPADEVLRRDLRTVEMIGRLNPGVSMEQGRGQMNALAADIAKASPATNTGIAVYFETLAHEVGKHTGQQIFMVVMVITVGLFLIACSNVGNLLLVRALSRRRQAAIQLSVGASASRLVRQALLETLLLFLAGGILGAIIGARLSPVLTSSIPVTSLDFLPGRGEIVMNWPVFCAIMALALLSAIMFGTGPALETARANIASELKDAAAAVSHTRKAKRLRLLLVVAQVFLAITLGSATLALVQSFHDTWASPLGFDNNGLLTFRISPQKSRYSDVVHRRRFFEAAVAAVTAAWPGSRVTAAEFVPFPWDYGSTRFQVDEQAAANPQQLPRASYNAVDPEFFATMRIPLAAGRLFDNRDATDPNLKAVVNETLVKQYLRGKSPIGHRVRLSALNNRFAEIVGVVPEIQIDDDARRGYPQIYVPFGQAMPESAGFIVRAPGGTDPLSAVPAIRRALAGVDARQPIFEVRTMDDRLNDSFAPFRIIAAMLVFFGGLALILAALGVYGMVAFSVSQRTREIGIRAALGADRGMLLRLFLRQGLLLFLFALAPGLLASFAATRGLNSMLGNFTTVSSGLPLAASAALLGFSVVVATMLPAWRAATTDPLAAIRHE